MSTSQNRTSDSGAPSSTESGTESSPAIWHQRTSPETIELLRTRRSLPNEFHRDPGPTPTQQE
ncbi:MAG: hypothetical protein WDZ49_00330, partial [Litorilinea sp.]